MKHLNLELEKLEERIATWAVPTCGGGSGSKGRGGSKSHEWQPPSGARGNSGAWWFFLHRRGRQAP